jgi:hypothetical protein
MPQEAMRLKAASGRAASAAGAGAAKKKGARVSKTVAVMQPYFFPYGGYFSLMRAVDHFVLFDCVQFPRRGWVHRNRVPGPAGKEEWLTLPLARQPRETIIRDLRFADDAEARLRERLRRYDWLSAAGGEAGMPVRELLSGPLPKPVKFLASSLRLAAGQLGLEPEFSFSSDLRLDPALRGEDRVIAAAKAVGGSCYVNTPGGRELYAAEAFGRHGLKLSFLNAYRGSHWSMLYRLCTEAPHSIAREIGENSRPESA